MSFHDRSPPDATPAPRQPVGRIDDLSALAAWCVMALRQVMEGRDALRDALDGQAGPARAAGVLAAFEALIDTIMAHARRPMMRRHAGCAGVGADEMTLAQLVQIAATGDREGALMLAMLIVRADVAPGLVAMAQEVGLGLMRLDYATGRAARLHHRTGRKGRLH